MTDQGWRSASNDDRSADRDYDYGVTDERDDAARRARREVAASIRQVAAAEPSASAEVRRAFETAARLAEGNRACSADEQPPHRSEPQ